MTLHYNSADFTRGRAVLLQPPRAVKHLGGKYKGVHYNLLSRVWESYFNNNSQRAWREYHPTQRTAALAYDGFIRRTFDWEGMFNFPRPGERSALCVDPACIQCTTAEETGE